MSRQTTDTATGRIRVRQVRSGICCPEDHKKTLKALGLSKVGRVRELPDNPAVRGMVFKVCHLVEVEEI